MRGGGHWECNSRGISCRIVESVFRSANVFRLRLEGDLTGKAVIEREREPRLGGSKTVDGTIFEKVQPGLLQPGFDLCVALGRLQRYLLVVLKDGTSIPESFGVTTA